MYESFYGLSAKPFRLRPDPHFFFGSKGHKRAMAYLEYGLSQGEGFIVITGEVGAGKTTLVRNLFNNLPSAQIVAAHIVNTHLDSDDTLRMVVSAFGLPYENVSKADLLTRLEQFLRFSDQQGKRALLVVDEAQNLKPGTVEELRMLSNINADKDQLLQVILVGQGELQETLRRPELRQFAQRVAVTYHLDPLDRADTQAYIRHRITVAGSSQTGLFTDEACEAVYRHSGGVPRLINLLCDAALVYAYAERALQVDRRLVDDVASDKKKGGLFPEQPQTRRGDGRVVATRAPGAESMFDNVATLATPASGRGGETVRNVDTEIVDYLKLRHADLYDKLRQAVNAMLHKTG